jgi:hypothetical protein
VVVVEAGVVVEVGEEVEVVVLTVEVVEVVGNVVVDVIIADVVVEDLSVTATIDVVLEQAPVMMETNVNNISVVIKIFLRVNICFFISITSLNVKRLNSYKIGIAKITES